MGSRDTEHCPHCGEDYTAGRPACPHCGSDAETGWSEGGILGTATDLPDEFTDDDYVEVLRGMGVEPPKRFLDGSWRSFRIAILLALLAIALVLWFPL